MANARDPDPPDRAPPQPDPGEVGSAAPRRLGTWTVVGLLLGLLGLALVIRATLSDPERAPADPSAEQAGAILEVEVTAAGAPVPDARVRIATRVRCEARTDASGFARLTDCPTGARRVQVDASGFARALHPAQLSLGVNPIAVALTPGAALRGRVRDEDQLPVAAALVTLRRSAVGPGAGNKPADEISPDAVWTVLTNDRGEFLLDTLNAGTFSLQVARAPYETVILPEVLAPAPEPIDVVLQRMAAVSGRVSGAPDQPLEGAAVILAGSGVWPPRVEQTGADGRFRFAAVPPGVYEVRAESGELVSPLLEGISIEPGQDVSLELALAPGSALHGTVLDAVSGKPLPGVRLRIAEDSLTGRPRELITGESGKFDLRGLRPLAHRAVVELAGYVGVEASLVPTSEPHQLALLRAGSVRGRVEDAQGEPIADAELELRGKIVTGLTLQMQGSLLLGAAAATSGQRASTSSGDNLGTTEGAVPPIPLAPRALGADVRPGSGFRSDDAGQFELAGIPPGEFRLWVRRSGFVPELSAPFSLTPAGKVEGLRIVLGRGGTVRGKVWGPDKQPVDQVRVTLTGPAEPARSTLTDEVGSFEFRAVQGRVTLAALPLGAPASQLEVEIANGQERRVELTLERATDDLGGRVIDTLGSPVARASVKIETSRSRGVWSATALTTEDGFFQLSGLPPPPYLLRSEHSDYAPGAEVTVSDTRKPVTLTLQAGVTLTGLVVDATSRDPIGGARVSLRRAGTGGSVDTADSDGDGRFELEHIADGSYTLQVAARDHITQSRVLSLRAQRYDRAPPEEEFALEAAGSLSGSVVDSLGAPVWNAEVTPGDPADWSRATRTDHSGQFQLAELLAGPVALSARKGALRTAVEARVHEGVDAPGVVLRFPGVAPEEPEAEGDEQGPASAAASRGFASPAPASEPPAQAEASTPLTLGRRGDLVIVERVAPGSQGAQVGLKSGDVVVAINGETVRSPAQARGMLSLLPGRGWVIDVRRGSERLRLRR